MDNFSAYINHLAARFSELPQNKKVGVLALIAIAVGSLFAMSLWVQAPDYQLLYSNLAPQDASAIVDKLKAQKVPYEVSNQGKTIRVASNVVHELRLQLAGEGLPEGNEVGLEIFEKSDLGMTDFIQKLNYQRALQGELARTIKTLEAVDIARVHLVMPKETVFVKEKPRGKASVMIKVNPGKSLSQAQIQGIVHLISASVENIEADDVVIVDLQGNLLSGGQEGTQDLMLTANNFQHKKTVEKELRDNILRMLEDALGKGKVIARVTADLNFEKVERTEEIFDPDSQVVRSEQIVTEATSGALPPGGVAGAQGLVPGGEGRGAGSGLPAKRDKENQTFNYEINKVVRIISEPVGRIQKLSVAVLVDGLTAGDPPAYQARSQEELDKFAEIVKSAIGYDEARGDIIKVENIQFDRSQALAEQAELAEAEKWNLAIEIGKLVLGLLGALFFYAWVIRPIKNWLTTSMEVVPEAAGELGGADMEAVEEEKQRLGEKNAEMEEIRQSVKDFAASDPKYAAGVVRKWLRDKGGPR
jgi:flagellar M-ring protein FliF